MSRADTTRRCMPRLDEREGGVGFAGRSFEFDRLLGLYRVMLPESSTVYSSGVRGAYGTTAGISGEMIRDLMVEAVEVRFGTDRAPTPLEWLSDNGSCYTAKETIDQAHALGLIPCFTPVQSPQSNGMAEAFVNTFKRDYVYVHDRPDALTVLARLHEWFEDYNEVHPHKGLKMRSPREFIRSQYVNEKCAAK